MAVLSESRTKSNSTVKTLFEISKPSEPSVLLRNLVNESKGKYTDYIHINWRDGKDEITMEPIDRNFKLYRDVYEKVGIVKNCIDNTADFALQSGYELEGPESARKKIEKFIKDTNFDLILHNILKQMQIYGNCFLEISRESVFDGDKWSLKILPVEQMRVVVFKGEGRDGQLKSYRQMPLIGNKPIDFTIEEVVHFKWNTATSPFYGISDIKAITATLTCYMNFQQDIGEIMHRYVAPVIHHKLGTEEAPATPGEIAEYKTLVDGRQTGQDMITSSNVEITPVVSNLKMVQPDGMIKLLQDELIGGLRVPEIFIRGGESSNKATADIELQAFDRKVKAIRQALGTMVEDYIFKKITPTSDVMISWNELSVESEHTKAEEFMWLVQAGVPIKVALDMCGWGSWINDVEEELKKVSSLPSQPLSQNPKPDAQAGTRPADKKPPEPKEEDYETQEEWFESHRKWKAL